MATAPQKGFFARFLPASGGEQFFDLFEQHAARSREAVGGTVGTLLDLKGRPRLLAHCTEVNRLENVGDQLLRRAVARLFRESPDPIHVIKWKEIYDYLENAIDRCEDVANVIEGVALEYT